MRRRSHLILLLILVLVGLGAWFAMQRWSGSGAGGGEAEVTDAGGPVPGGTLVVAYAGPLDSLNPLVGRSSATMDVLEQLFPSLFEVAFECGLRFEPGLVESWAIGDDGRTLILTLEDDRSWEEGEAIDADDVLVTLNTTMEPELRSHRAASLQGMTFERAGDHEVIVRFDEAMGEFAALGALGRNLVVPEHGLVGVPAADIAAHPYSGDPEVAGPFVVDRWERRGDLVLLAREGDGRPLLDRVVVRVLDDPTARLRAFEAGEVDLVAGLGAQDVQQLATTRPDARIVRRGERFVDFVAWNLADERFADPRVRTALAHAVDVESLIGALLATEEERYGRRAVGTVPPVLCGAHADGIEPLGFEPARARTMLAEAGVDGLGFELAYASGNERREQAALILQQQLAEVGVEVVLQPMDASALYPRLRQGRYEAALVGWAKGLVVDPRPFWGTGGAYNVTGYADDEVDALIERGLEAGVGEEADAVWREVQATIYMEQPALFLYWVDDLVAVDPRFRDTRIDAVSLLGGLERWWVPVGERRYPAEP